ncbi:DUF11 domain-containing protein [Agromyces mediolanus]|uniref:DUF11 domain-containing protein n=1 Tax=Agromyces mediolanus TaxID=41986 RepID=UPI00203B29AF|nr:DUF11 domain-containing protein [Agromyces mediolanus]MCM3658103.1 DUF11 domain-containing protein [Agromyces mediolanus]
MPQAPPAQATTITSPGPLSSIVVGPDLNCAVNHVLDSSPEWYGGTACGTFASLNGTLFGPQDVPAGGGASPRTRWLMVSQTATTGSGTVGDPYTVVTVVRSTTGVELTQTDRYVVGNEFYDTSLSIANPTAVQQLGTIYTAGDCYLQNSDLGYGKIFGTSPACATSTLPGSRLEQLIPRTGGNNFYQAGYSSVWSRIGAQQPFPDTCACNSYIDNGIGISWPLNIAPGGTSVFEWTTAFSPAGVVPMTITATADVASVLPGAADGYTLRVSNPNATSGVLDELTVTLPDGFAYTPGSTTGFTTSDPVVSGNTLTFSGPFTVPPNGLISVHFGVAAGTIPGTYTIDASGTSPDFDVSGTTNAAPITVLAVSDLSVAKTTATPTVVAGGAPIVFDVVATNAGPGTAPNVQVTDTVPPGMTFSASASSPTCFVLSGQVRCSVASLAPGASASFQIAFTAAGTTSGTFSNTAVVSGDVQDGNLSNNSSTANFTVERRVDVSVTKSASPTTVAAGAVTTYTMTVHNAGPSSANYTLVDSLPVGVTATSITGSGCTITPSPRCSGVLAAGASTVVTLQATVAPGAAAGTVLVNSAAVTTPQIETVTDNNIATASNTVSRSANLAILKALSSGLVAGYPAVYTLDVTNAGPSSATNVVVTDPVPAGLTFDPLVSSPACSLVGADVMCTSATLAPTSTLRFVIGFTLPADTPAGMSIANTATVASDEPDPAPADNTSTSTADVSRLVDLVASKTTVGGVVVAGGAIDYDVTVTNRGPSLATEVKLTDPAPAGVTWTAAASTAGPTADCTVDAASVACTITELQPGETAAVRLTGTLASSLPAGPVSNTVTATSAEPEATPDDNTADDSVNVAVESGLELHKEDSAPTGVAGAGFGYTFTLINRGPSDAVDATLTDTLPTELRDPVIVSQPAGDPCSITDGELDCSFGTVPADPDGTSPLVVTVSGTLDPALATGTTLQNTASATDATGATVTADETTQVIRESTFTVVKTPMTDPVVAGAPLDWTVVVANEGPSVSDGPVMIETPDAGYTITAMSGDGATCEVATLTCDLGTLPPDGTVTITVSGTVSADRPAGPLVNRATVLNPQGEDPSDEAQVDVSRVADLTLMKTAAPEPVRAGDVVLYTLVVGNTGPSTANDVVVADTLPSGLTFFAGPSTAGCSVAGQVVSCPVGALAVGESRVIGIAASTDPTFDGVVTNTATAVGTEDDPDGATATTDSTVVPEAAVSLEKTGGPAIAGQNLTWTLTVSNAGPSAAADLVLTDTLAPSLGFVSGVADDGTVCSADALVVTCELADLAPNGQTIVTIVTSTSPSAVPHGQASVTVGNTARVTSSTPDDDPDDNTANALAVIAALVHLTPSKSGPAEVIAGTDGSYVLGVANSGPSTATNVEVVDRLDPSLTFDADASDPACTLSDPGQNEVRCRVDELGVGDSATFTVVVRFDPSIAPGSLIVNAAAGVADQTDIGFEPPASVTTLVQSQADVSIEKRVTSPIAAGEEAVYTIVVSNTGPSSALGVRFSDVGPADGLLGGGLQRGLKGAPDCPVEGIRFECTIPQLLPGESITITMSTGTDPALPDGTEITNVATVESDTPDMVTENNADESTLVIVRQSTLSLTKVASVDAARPGASVDWTLVVGNGGPSVADETVVTDTLPDGLVLTAAPSGCTVSTATVTCEVGALAPGETSTIVLGTRVADGADGPVTNSASASATGAEGVTATATLLVDADAQPPIASTGWANGWLAVVAMLLIGAGGLGVTLVRRRPPA